MPQQVQQAQPTPQVPPQNFAPLQNVTSQPGFGWGKAAGMLFAVLIPAGLVVYANHLVFPESSWIAIGMIVSTCGIAGIFSIASGYATTKCRRYCLIASLVLGVVLSCNLAAHWVLSREKSAADQATAARHAEEDRAEARREADARRQKELLDAQARIASETAKQLQMEAIRNDSARRLGIRAPRGLRINVPQSAPVTATSVEPAPQPADGTAPRITVEQVMAKWSVWLLWFAVADLLCSVIAYGICALMWEWDKNRNGIPDHLEQWLLAQQYWAQQTSPMLAQNAVVVAPAASAAPPQPVAQHRPAAPVQTQNGLPRP